MMRYILLAALCVAYVSAQCAMTEHEAALRRAGGSAVFTPKGDTCGVIKAAFKDSACCGDDAPKTNYTLVGPSSPMQVVPKPSTSIAGTNICAGKKPIDGFTKGDGYFNNQNCTALDGVVQVLEQAGANVTRGYHGQIDALGANRMPITTTYLEAGMCPVNVHWHLGTEHYSLGEYDERGTGPVEDDLPEDDKSGRRAATRIGFRCHKYDAKDSRFTTPYNFKYCEGMKVGETYEVHWPHSAAGACGTPNQWQTPFYDGVFCRDGIISLNPLNVHQKVGVQAQVFTIINDENYYYPDLMRGMIVEGDFGADMVKYTGSTTGTSRDNTMCSKYTPITWQVDRKCHLISASSFDKMCADMRQQRDDMSSDTHAHGSRKLVADFLAANNQQRRAWFDTEMVNAR